MQFQISLTCTYFVLLLQGIHSVFPSKSSKNFDIEKRQRVIPLAVRDLSSLQKSQPVKKKQAGRKQYEVSNRLRIPIIVGNIESTTNADHSRNIASPIKDNKIIRLNHFANRQFSNGPYCKPATRSLIEFYYANENRSRLKQHRRKYIDTTKETSNVRVTDSRRYAFTTLQNINHYFQKPTSLTTKIKTKSISYKSNFYQNLNPLQFQKQVVSELPSYDIIYNSKLRTAGKVIADEFFDNLKMYGYAKRRSVPKNLEVKQLNILSSILNNKQYNSSDATENLNYKINIESSTMYDKVKFFEMHDNQTHNHISGKTSSYDLSILQKVTKADVNADELQEDTYNWKNRHSRQTFDLSNLTNANNVRNNKLLKSIYEEIVKLPIAVKYSTNNIRDTKTKDYSQNDTLSSRSSKISYIKKLVSWNDYPYASVYIHEPSQVYCDAAALSPHWLIAAGSCLSRTITNKMTDVYKSAYVTYCGGDWRNPVRIAYVKYSIVHPQFHTKEKNRKLLYNVGAIKVISSMSACNGWSPATLMSHQFVPIHDDSPVLAIGWGLDRLESKFSIAHVTKTQLTMFEGTVFNTGCIQNPRHGMEKGEELNVIKNVYCLQIPQYINKKDCSPQGSLLIVEGKLAALYLQEKRSSWSVQTAQYTGLWKVVPWVTEIAREPLTEDFLPLDVM